MKDPYERAFAFYFTGAVVALLVISLIAYRSTAGYLVSNEWVRHTYEVLDHLSSVTSLVRAAETNRGSFLLTGDPAYLSRYTTTVAEIGPALARVTDLASDNPSQQARLRRLSETVRARLDVLRETIDLYQRNQVAAATDILLSKRGDRLMGEALGLAAEADLAERMLLATRGQESRSASRRLIAALAVFASLAAVTLTGLCMVVVREARRRGRAEDESRSLHEGLERRVEERTRELGRTVDELRRADVDRAYLATIVESSHDAIVGKSLTGVITSWNLGAERIFGYTAAEAVDRPVRLLLMPDRQEEEELILERLARGESLDHFETVRISKDGRPIDVSLTISPIKDRSGRIVGISSIIRDISERKRAEVALLRSEAQFRLLADSIPQLAWMARPDGHIFWYNKPWYAYTGTIPTEMEGWGWKSVHDPEVLPGVLASWNRSIAEGRPFEMVFPIRGSDGQFRKFLTRVLPSRDDNGEVLGWFGTNTDIDEQTRAEEALRDSEERLLHLNDNLERLVRERTAELSQRVRLIDQAHEAILVRDRDGVISSWNQGAERLYGWGRHEAEGRVLHELLKTQFPRPLPEIEEEFAKLRSWEGELVHERRDRVQVVVKSRWIADRQGAAEETVLEINSDITEWKKAEAALRESRDFALSATQAKGEFLANMSHEIRTPMNGVIGITDLLLDTRLDELQKSYIEAIRSCGEALLTVINDILDFSKIEAGKLTLESTEFDLRSLLEEVADLLTPSARRKDLKILCQFDREVPRRLVGDPVRIRQVLTNLAGNAVKFTERGEVGLESRLMADDGDQATIRILVRDTGIGIPADRQADIFESFSQVDGGNSRRHGGTGLGLTICQSLVALMGGRIGLESRPGEGSTFWFDVSLVKGIAMADPTDAPLDGLRVLVIGDQEADRESLQEVLLSWDCRTEVTSSGVEALTRLLADPEDDPFGLIVLDQDIPGIDHEWTARVIRAIPRHASIPIVLITAPGPAAEAVEDSLWAARMARPIRRSLLYNAIRRAVGGPASRQDQPPPADPERTKLASPPRILLAEDNEINRVVAIGMMKRLGCEVEAVWNGREAVEAVDYDRHDLILMDVQMPRMDGFTATAAIREREQATGRHIPIIALTAHTMEGDRERCLAGGMDDYLSKPIRLGTLREALRSWGGKADLSPNQAIPSQEPNLATPFAQGLVASCGNDLELARQILKLMLKGIPARLERLGEAITSGNERQRLEEAHGLKGGFATVGAQALALACQEMLALGEGDSAAIREGYRGLQDQWKALEIEASRYLETLCP